MKILHLISSGGLYGAETMMVALSRQLQKDGHSSLIGVFDNAHLPNTEIADYAQSKGVPVKVVSCKGRIDRRAVSRLRHILREERVDVIHAHGYKADIYGYAANFGLNHPILSTCHTWYDNDFAALLYGILDRQILRLFDMTIAVSEAVAAELRGAGVRPEKIRLIDNGIDLHSFIASRATLRHELQTSKKLIGTVARLAPEKGIEYLLRAAVTVLREQPDVLFVIVGDGPDRQKLTALAQELGIGSHVIFTGARRDIPGVYASLDVLVQPSLKEGLPMTLLEGLAAGRATVATRVGAVERVVLHEKTGLITEPADSPALANAIVRLLNDEHLRKRLGEAGHNWIRDNFSAEAMARTYLELYQSLGRGND